MYSFGFKWFQVSKDGKYSKENNNELLISKQRKFDTVLAQSYIVLRSITQMLTMIQENPEQATYYDTITMYQ